LFSITASILNAVAAEGLLGVSVKEETTRSGFAQAIAWKRDFDMANDP
jgi:hypothetical protein